MDITFSRRTLVGGFKDWCWRIRWNVKRLSGAMRRRIHQPIFETVHDLVTCEPLILVQPA